jgi:hypothetical protein
MSDFSGLGRSNHIDQLILFARRHDLIPSSSPL